MNRSPTSYDSIGAPMKTFFIPAILVIGLAVPGVALAQIQCGGGACNGTPNAESIVGSSVRDVIKANDGNDAISAWGGNDEIHGGAGNDLTNGWTGNDVIYGDKG